EYFERRWADVRAESLVSVASSYVSHAHVDVPRVTPQPRPEAHALARTAETPPPRVEPPVLAVGPFFRRASVVPDAERTPAPPRLAGSAEPDDVPRTAESSTTANQPPSDEATPIWHLAAESIPLVPGIVRVDLEALGEGVEAF